MTQSEVDKELRIGLVLYGGVSLCIYIYGVVYEFLRLVRNQEAGNEAYKKLAELAKVRPVIDVISGTSAGGINGLFLAKALSTGASLDPLKELWIEEGDLEKLLDVTSSKPVSLLDSKRYIELIEGALNKLSPSPAQSSACILDLFITSTDLDGVAHSQVADITGKPISSMSYGTRFHFRVRPTRYPFLDTLEKNILPRVHATLKKDQLNERNDFHSDSDSEPTRNRFLAKVAAATSAFPVAFAPVKFTRDEKKQMEALFDTQFFNNDEDRGQDSVYGDGGMVNNYPFNYTIGTIFRRQADLPVDRRLFYVEPDPRKPEKKRLAERHADSLDSLLGTLQAKLYESITDDLESVRERNERINDINHLIKGLEGRLEAFLGKHAANLREGFAGFPLYEAYRGLKVHRLRKELEENLLAKAGHSEALQSTVNNLLKSKAEDTRQFLITFDFPFRVRRLRCFIKRINQWICDETFQQSQPVETEELGRLKGNLYACIEFYYAEDRAIWAGLEPLTLANVEGQIEQICQKRKSMMEAVTTQDIRPLIKEIDGLKPDSVPASPPLIDIYDSYEFIDMHVFPATVIADVGEADHIETVRVSPSDASRYLSGENVVQAKLSGENLMHFSAFLKMSWRENDLIWGRLDAAEVLVRTLLPNEQDPDTIHPAAKPILDELCKGIIAEEMRSIRKRRRTQIDMSFLKDAERETVLSIFKEKDALNAQETEDYFARQYSVGRESMANISREYILRTSAKAFRTFTRLLNRVPEKVPNLLGTGLKRPLSYLNKISGLLYFLLVTLKGYRTPICLITLLLSLVLIAAAIYLWGGSNGANG